MAWELATPVPGSALESVSVSELAWGSESAWVWALATLRLALGLV